MRKIAYLATYPLGTAPSQRFRVEQYIPYWKKYGVKVDVFPFYSDKSFQYIYQSGKIVQKTVLILIDFIRRFLLLFILKSYPVIFIQRGVAPIGPPIFEWILKKILRKKLIYDFDDAIWIPDERSSSIVKFVKSYSKVSIICGWADLVISGNDYLAEYAEGYTKKVIIIPTVVDTENKYSLKTKNSNGTNVIGWTGSHSTMKYLDLIIPILQKLEQKHNFKFKVISNKNPELPLSSFEYIQWTNENEIKDLSQFDIGIMPLIEDAWSKGKCGFKAIQYMALGIPAIVSPVGVNAHIVDHEQNGYLADELQEWEKYLSTLISNVGLREKYGKEARRKIEHHYSINSVLPQWKELFDELFA